MMPDPETMTFLQKGFGLLQAGQVREAEDIGRRVLQTMPQCVEAMLLCAGAARSQGQLERAVDLLRQAIGQRPGAAVLYLNLGEALLAMNRAAEAADALRQAVALSPHMADAHVNLGNALLRTGASALALEAHQKAVSLAPKSAVAHYNLGRSLQACGQMARAAEVYEHAIRLRPAMAQAHYNLGTALQALHQSDRALSAYQQAVACQPNYFQAWNNLGLLLGAAGKVEEARHAFEQAAALNPSGGGALANLAGLCADEGQIDESLALYRRALANEPQSSAIHSSLVFVLHSRPGFGPEELGRELAEWDRRHARALAPKNATYPNSHEKTRTLRIGYISGEFRDHAVGWNLRPLMRHADRAQVEMHCYSNGTKPDAVTEELRTYCATWREIGHRSDDEVAQAIREDQIDILVDLNLHTRNNRLLVLARKPAPVQATFAGYPGSTGLSAIDYRLSDPYLDPPGMFDAFCSEQTIRLPHSFWCFDPEADYPAIGSLPEGPIRLACLNSSRKVNGQVLELFGRVMSQIADSRLMLLEAGPRFRQHVVDVQGRAGIDPDRVEFFPRMPRRAYLELYHQAHLSLDPFPYGGHMTGLDSFWMGVPVVTLVGQTIVSRAGWSHLSNLGLTELAAHTPDEYVRIARALAADRPRLAELHRSLRQRMLASPLTNGMGFALAVEAAYRQMWCRWCDGEPNPVT